MKILAILPAAIVLCAVATADVAHGQPTDLTTVTNLTYRCIGPTRGGRATTVTGVPSQPATFYMGATGGGVWKTTDYGQSWKNISDGFFDSASIGAMRVAPSNEDVIYVGTGSDGLRSNVLTGRGVYRSSDAGDTWEFIGLRNAGQIGAVEIHPKDENVVYVAVIGQAFGRSEERGVYRTKNGGKTWEKIFYVSDQIGAVDLELHPADPTVIYASMWRGERKPWTIISGGPGMGGIYRSQDAGDTWSKLENGLPSGLFGKSDLAVSAADPNRVYALIEAEPDGGLYRSDDRGDTWELASKSRGLLDRPFYYCNIDADPQDADLIYVWATGAHKSTNGGRSWTRLRTPHGDNHDAWISPHDSNLFVQANDGGVNVTRDGGRTWSTQQNQPTAELYQVEVDDRYPYWVYAGQQDNSTIRVPAHPPYSHPLGPKGFWQTVGGCETGPAVPKPGDADIVYANCKGRFGRFNMRTGQEKKYYVGAANMYGHNPKDLQYRFQRVAPIHVSPHDPNRVYHASQFVHVTDDEGVTWRTISPDLTAFEPDKQVISGTPITRDITGEEFYSTIYAIRESPVRKGLIWVGANDGPVSVTTNGGGDWARVTPKDLAPGGRVDAVEPSPHRAEKAYIAVYRFLLGDFRPYIYRTNDYGATWTLLTTGQNGIPADCPTRVIREDPDREGLLYAGCDLGLFVSFDDGKNWQSLQNNLPVTPITDMKVHRKDLVISTMGRSFWVLDNLTPLHQAANIAAQSRSHLFEPRKAIRTRSRGRGDAHVSYLPAGAQIDYWLADDAKDGLRLEIIDSQGQVVRSIQGGQRGGGGRRARPGNPQERGMRGPGRRGGRGGGRRLETTKGAHRHTWDFRCDADGARVLALPGDYTVRLTALSETRTVPLRVDLDPRLVADGVTVADLESQRDLIIKVSKLQARSRALTTEVARALTRAATEERKAELRTLRDRLQAPRGGAYPQPMLNAQITYLSSMINAADQKLGNHAYLRYEQLVKAVSDCEKAFDSVK